MSSTGTPDLAARLAAALAQLPPDARAVLGQALAPAAQETEGPGPQVEATPAPEATEAPSPSAEELITPGARGQQLQEKGKGKAPPPQPEQPTEPASGPSKAPNKLPPSLPLSTAKGPGKSKEAETPIDVEKLPDPAAPGDIPRASDQDMADSKLLDAAAQAMAASHMNLAPGDRPTVQLAAPITDPASPRHEPLLDRAPWQWQSWDGSWWRPWYYEDPGGRRQEG